jgi:hypothetical protein
MAAHKQDLLEAAIGLMALMGEQGLSVAPGSALQRAHDVLRAWAAGIRPAGQPDFGAFVSALEVGELAVRILRLREPVPGMRGALADLARASTAAESQRSDPNDVWSHRLLELRIALAALSFAKDVELDEPDVKFRNVDRTTSCLVACKVPHGQPGRPTPATLTANIVKGISQIRRAALGRRSPEVFGLVVLSQRNHMSHDLFMPPLADAERVRNLSHDEVMAQLSADTDRMRELLTEESPHGGSIAEDVTAELVSLGNDDGILAGVAFLQGSTFIKDGRLSPVRRLWSPWPLDDQLLERLNGGLQYPSTPRAAALEP